MTKCQKDPTLGTFLKRGLFKDIKNDTLLCQTHKYPNTDTQIHKSSIRQSARKTQHMVFFWKGDCSRISKMIFPCVKRTNTQTQIHKYIWRNAKKTQQVVYILKEDCSGIWKMIFLCVKRTNTKKCKYANTQIQHMKKFTVSGLGLGLGHNEITRLVFFHTIERSVLVPEWPTHNFWCFSSSF